MRGLVAFPKMVMHFDVARQKSVDSIEKALKDGGKLPMISGSGAWCGGYS